jgi:methionyl-tRNA formyltransferase
VKRMKILFLGTDKFAVPPLEAIIKKHEIVAVVTRPDKPRGRGMKVSPTPVKTAADKLGIPVLEPASLKNKEFRETIARLDFDLVVLVAYGRLLPEEFIERPPLGCICLHPSMLPQYRGCSPIESAIKDGNEKTGISIFYIEKDFDTGDIIYQEEVEIKPDDTGGSLRERLSFESPEIILRALESIETGKTEKIIQDTTKATWAPKIEKEDALIKWNEPARNIYNQIRAFNPKPGAFTLFRGKILKINLAEILKASKENENPKPGKIIDLIKNEGIAVACGESSLLLKEVQPEGKPSMTAWAFVQGYRPTIGEMME